MPNLKIKTRDSKGKPLPLTKRQFNALSPYLRGFAVYMMGARADRPNVPDESNPYKEGTHKHRRWARGNMNAYLAVLDTEE